MPQPAPLEYESHARSRCSSRGCLVPLAGGLWVLLITFTVPANAAARFYAPLWLKCVFTVGHVAAVAAMLYPFRKRALATWVLAILVSLFAAMQVMVLWSWN